jgi:hypothetical protein
MYSSTGSSAIELCCSSVCGCCDAKLSEFNCIHSADLILLINLTAEPEPGPQGASNFKDYQASTTLSSKFSV